MNNNTSNNACSRSSNNNNNTAYHLAVGSALVRVGKDGDQIKEMEVCEDLLYSTIVAKYNEILDQFQVHGYDKYIYLIFYNKYL